MILMRVKEKAITKADIVISMLPAHLHIRWQDCVYKKFVTASYISDAMQELMLLQRKQLSFMNEIGLGN
jgi:saccharopine dehydrogenase-like NADP-dependent oxidoreductase